MKTCRNIILLAVGLIWLTACKSLETNAYRTIGSIVVTVDGAMTAYGQAVRDGKVSEQEQAKVKKDYEDYRGAIKVAQVAVSAYRFNPDATQLNKAISVASAIGSDLTRLIYSIIQKGP